jgi:NAD-dependent SIR2 family protein deacetylase
LEEYKKHNTLQPEECRDCETYFNDMIAWKNKIENERAAKVRAKEEKEDQLYQGYSFKPKIS